MLITKNKIKIIIREEIVKALEEKDNLSRISESKEKFLQIHPQAKDPQFDSEVQNKLKSAFKKVKKSIVSQYLSDQRKESFVRFIKSMPKFKNQPKEDILDKFNFLQPKILGVIKKTPIQSINVGTHTPQIYNIFLNKRNTIALYDPDTDKIIVNPYHKGIMGFGGLNLKKLESVLREEIYHAIDLNLSMKDKLGIIPMHILQTGIAQRKGIFTSQEDSGLSRDEYEYYTIPTEFYAKMLRLKDLVAEKYPDKIDQQTGKIKEDFLKYLLSSAKKRQYTIFGDDGETLKVLQVLNPRKIGQVQKFFDLIAKRSGQKTA